jgi:sigma-B regulation protein RsbU (phosphoserine phosphatase)
MSAGRAAILVCAADPQAVADVRALLEQAGHEIAFHRLSDRKEVDAEPEQLSAHRLVVVEGTQNEVEALQFCQRVRARCGMVSDYATTDGFLPILLVTGDRAPDTERFSSGDGADAYLFRPFAPVELFAQVGALLRTKDTHDRLTEKSAEVHRINRRLHQAYQQIDQELELARRIQFSLLPKPLPEVPRVRFAVHHALSGRVGGDFYDVFRLDENHVGFYVADAMGHGVPASLLTVFVRNGVRAKEVIGQHYSLTPPAQVLHRLNRELVEQSLSEHPFITMAYALYNHADNTLHFARAGHPHPLHVPRDGEPRFWQVEGSLLGVFDTEFHPSTHHLNAGDKVLFYSDGIDTAQVEEQPPGADSLRACAARHRELPVEEFIAALARDLFREAKQTDDLTLLGMEVVEA